RSQPGGETKCGAEKRKLGAHGQAFSLWSKGCERATLRGFCQPAASLAPMAEDAAQVLSVLEQLAPLELAENWDNVGLIVDPRESGDPRGYQRAFLTIDLTASTLAEAIERGADLIVAYHPPIFSGLKRLRQRVAAERLILEAISRGLTIYSPHTALDAARAGMAEWLALACGPGDLRPITPTLTDPEVGPGRVVTLHEPLRLDQAIARIKQHLGLQHVRVA